LAISVLGVFIAFVILQETFAQRHWRGLVNRGDRWAIKTLVEQEIERWRDLRVPKGTSPVLWHGIQTAGVVGVGRDFIHLICNAEAEYRLTGGRREEISSPLDEGMKLDAALLERVFYDIPNVRLSQVRIDVFTTFRGEDGTPDQRCILTTVADRADADKLPWDDLRPNEIVARFQSRYELGPNGAALPIDPGPPWAEEEDEPSPPEEANDRAPAELPGPSVPDPTDTDQQARVN
jgi:hypothetical protein